MQHKNNVKFYSDQIQEGIKKQNLFVQKIV